MVYAVGQQIEFSPQSGEVVSGEIVGRDWCFERLVSYNVACRGVCYTVNANSFEAGHSHS